MSERSCGVRRGASYRVGFANTPIATALRLVDTLWRGGLGSFAVTGSTIAHQHAATQAAIRTALGRRAAVYQTPNGLMLPIAFKIGVGRNPD